MGRSTDAAWAALPENAEHADRTRSASAEPKGITMLLATTTVEDVDRFLEVFSTKGVEKRAAHGSKGANVFRDPTEENRVWALFDWDADGWKQFV